MASIVSWVSWAMNIAIILVTAYLFFIYLKSPSFRSYPCYFNLILSVVIFFDNILRLYNAALSAENPGEEGEKNVVCYIQAFCLSLFDKLMLIFLTVNSMFMFMGVVKHTFLQTYMKQFFITSIAVGAGIALILSIVFIINEQPEKLENICYPRANEIKKTIDTIVTSLLSLTDFYCTIRLLLHLTKGLQETKKDSFRVSNLNYHYRRFFCALFLDGFTFLSVILIINNCFFFSDGDVIDLVYVSICLVIVCFYTFNDAVIKETCKLLGCAKEEQRLTEVTQDNENDKDNQVGENNEEENNDN